MNINKTQDGNRTILTLSGRLDTTTAPKLQEALFPELEEAKYVKLDFAGITYVSSAGLRVLLVGEKTAKAKDVKMVLVNVSQEIMEIFEMTGFTEMLSIE